MKDGFHGERSAVMPPFIRDRLAIDPFLSTLYITDIGYYPCASHHKVKRVEPLGQYVLLYCMVGSGSFSVANGCRGELHENQYVILPSGVGHEYAASADIPWTIYWIHFGGTLAGYYAKDAGIPQNVKPNAESRINNRISLFEEILNVMQTELSDDNLHYASSLLHHFLASLRYLHTYREASLTVDRHDVVKAAKHFIEENIERRISLKQIADYVGLSVSNFSKKFKQDTDESPMAYINTKKMERACTFLANTDMLINQVSYKVGISDALYFSRMFSQYAGMSPTEYRHNAKKNNDNT